MDQLLLPGIAAAVPLDEGDIRADYEALLDRCARLMAYAQSSPRHVFWSVVERQDRLAEDDLVVFALRARRFIGAVSLISLAHNVVVPVGGPRPSQCKSVWRVITTMIHYTSLFPLRTAQRAQIIYKGLRGTLQARDLINDPHTPVFPPIVFLISEHEHMDFRLSDFIQIFTERILRPATKVCRDYKIDLAEVDEGLEWAAEQLPKWQGDDIMARL